MLFKIILRLEKKVEIESMTKINSNLQIKIEEASHEYENLRIEISQVTRGILFHFFEKLDLDSKNSQLIQSEGLLAEERVKHAHLQEQIEDEFIKSEHLLEENKNLQDKAEVWKASYEKMENDFCLLQVRLSMLIFSRDRF